MRAAHRPAFTLVELITAIACVGIVLSLLVPLAYRQRQTASLNESIANLQQISGVSTQYAADNADLFATFSWQANVPTPSEFPDLRGPFATRLEAAAAQAIDTIRRLGNRTAGDTPRPANWIPHVLYSHLALADYAKIDLPWRAVISPEDDRRICWANDPTRFSQNPCPPQPDPAPINARWPYSSSYELGVVFFSVDSGPNAVTTGGAHNTYITPGGDLFLANRRNAEVAFPAQKAFMWDSFQRHFGPRRVYFMADEARVPVLAVDGSVRVREGRNTNRGWIPNQPTNPQFSTINYQPAPWEPPAPVGAGSTYPARQRFTASGLSGRDFDGDEVR